MEKSKETQTLTEHSSLSETPRSVPNTHVHKAHDQDLLRPPPPAVHDGCFCSTISSLPSQLLPGRAGSPPESRQAIPANVPRGTPAGECDSAQPLRAPPGDLSEQSTITVSVGGFFFFKLTSNFSSLLSFHCLIMLDYGCLRFTSFLCIFLLQHLLMVEKLKMQKSSGWPIHPQSSHTWFTLCMLLFFCAWL